MLAAMLAVFRKAGQNPLACLVPILAERKLIVIAAAPTWWITTSTA
jgi:hypothetical protein